MLGLVFRHYDFTQPSSLRPPYPTAPKSGAPSTPVCRPGDRWAGISLARPKWLGKTRYRDTKTAAASNVISPESHLNFKTAIVSWRSVCFTRSYEVDKPRVFVVHFNCAWRAQINGRCAATMNASRTMWRISATRTRASAHLGCGRPHNLHTPIQGLRYGADYVRSRALSSLGSRRTGMFHVFFVSCVLQLQVLRGIAWKRHVH